MAGDRTGILSAGGRVEAFRVHMKPLEKNRVWHLRTKILLFRNFRGKMRPRSNHTELFQGAFSPFLDSIANHPFFECPSPLLLGT